MPTICTEVEFDLRDYIDEIVEEFCPEEVFPDEELIQWAVEEGGFIHEDVVDLEHVLENMAWKDIIAAIPPEELEKFLEDSA